MSGADMETMAVEQVAHWRSIGVTADDCLRTLGRCAWVPGGWPDVFCAVRSEAFLMTAAAPRKAR